MSHSQNRRTGPLSSSTAGAPGYIWALVGALALIELVLTAADAGWVGDPRWRTMALLLGAFWPPLLAPGAGELYPLQREAMFLTHAFLHANFLHMVMNGVILLSLGKVIGEKVGAVRTYLLFGASAVAGGAAFGLISMSSGPMIGASGAAFGFLGIWNAWDFQRRKALGLSLRPILSMVLGLAIANLALFVFLQGGLAWEAHLGGYLMGWAAAFTFARLR
ncbi:rhomboid family intramembrane serine protease [Cereibacter sphaeroides]|uniref:rhomboid family intramembrane serine protease n=1 Tax=Cereibacter sphaeroides TaxID=1063 RepID=UPI003FCC90AE